MSRLETVVVVAGVCSSRSTTAASVSGHSFSSTSWFSERCFLLGMPVKAKYHQTLYQIIGETNLPFSVGLCIFFWVLISRVLSDWRQTVCVIGAVLLVSSLWAKCSCLRQRRERGSRREMWREMCKQRGAILADVLLPMTLSRYANADKVLYAQVRTTCWWISW